MDKIYEIINSVRENAKKNKVPIVRDKTLNALIDTCIKHNVKNVLEIGTATGYSGLNLLTVADKVTTIEKNILRFEEAKQNFENANVGERVKQVCGDAGIELEELARQDEKFDLIFLDGPKGQYVRYLPSIMQLLNQGGILFADNILLGGLIKQPSRVTHKNRAMYNNMLAFWSEIQGLDCLTTKIYEIEDGFSISTKQ